jgi:hypothetical protein
LILLFHNPDPQAGLNIGACLTIHYLKVYSRRMFVGPYATWEGVAYFCPLSSLHGKLYHEFLSKFDAVCTVTCSGQLATTQTPN